MLKKMELDVDTILHTPLSGEHNKRKHLKNKFEFWEKCTWGEIIVDIKNHLYLFFPKKRNIKKRLAEHRYINFSKFNNRYIQAVPDKNYKQELYDYVILGSDQIWNPYGEGRDTFYFQPDVAGEKKVTYAPSFGVDAIPDDKDAFYEEMLSGYGTGAVREESGKLLYEKYTGKSAEILVDPTMLLSENDWSQLCIEESAPQKKYILVYFLALKSEKVYRIIKKYAQKNGYEVILLLQQNKYYAYGPTQFVNLIKNAELLITDSFHGCVFSIIMHTKFQVLSRTAKNSKENMNSRIDTLLSKFSMQNAMVDNSQLCNKEIVYDFGHSDKVLEAEKGKALNYLSEKLGKGK
ncbi:MAG: polysaccharide pyruvyl transferase family protein [Lachnospiraceae bacterium]|nr:polysaccharide pyruvyl transferase family protein [Lachnospiraceae bacterium]